MTTNCSEFRRKIVQFILKLKENYEEISRNSVFLAISILDKYLNKSID